MSVIHQERVDIAIVGGGLVGSSLALALENCGVSVALIEAAETAQHSTGFDQRKLALAHASVQALQKLGVLTKLQNPLTEIERIHVSRVGDFGRVLLEAKQFGHNAFGSVILAQDLGLALVQRVAELPHVLRVCPAQVVHCEQNRDEVNLQIKTASGVQNLRAQIVIAADGTHSFIRHAVGIHTQSHDYQQVLFVCSIQAETASHGTAYERFSEQGPVALLPMAKGAYGSICAVHSTQANTIAELSDSQYAEYFQQRFGWRAGKIMAAGKRSYYPIKRVLAEQLTKGRVVLMGNAAQTIHPIGAQGFNLGLRDALCFANLLSEVGLQADLLEHYAHARFDDRKRVIELSDGLAKLTANNGLPMHIVRSSVLSLLGIAPRFASGIIQQSMGITNPHDIQAYA